MIRIREITLLLRRRMMTMSVHSQEDARDDVNDILKCDDHDNDMI